MSEFAGYLKYRNTGSLVGISKKSLLEQLAMENQQLIKQKKQHLIKYDVIFGEPDEEIKNDSGDIEIQEKRKPGRKPANN